MAAKMDSDTGTKLDLVLKAVEDIKRNQDGLRISLEKRIDKLRSDIKADMDSKMKNLKDEMVLDLNKESCRIDELLNSVHLLQSRMQNFESKCTVTNSTARVPLNDPDLTITANGLSYSDGESIVEKAKSLIKALG